MASVDKFGRKLDEGKRVEVVRGIQDALVLDTDGHYTADNKRIKLVRDPEKDADAVNRKWLETHFLKQSTGQVSLGLKRLAGLKNPEKPDDATTKQWVEGRLKDLEYVVEAKTGGGYESLDNKITTLTNEVNSLRTLLQTTAAAAAGQPKRKKAK